jgi:hypothetical protein
MNPWDLATWLSAFALAGSAATIFWFFLKDARSIFDREMHDQDEAPEDASASEAAADGAPSAPPEDLPR